jgi:hypothetical protein
MSDSSATPEALRLKVGCEFGLETSRAVDAVMQVAPLPERDVRLDGEAWHTPAGHHGYIDDHGNRCERLAVPPGSSRVAYEAEVTLTDPADALDTDASETPVTELPDEVLPTFCQAASASRTNWAARRGSASATSRLDGRASRL